MASKEAFIDAYKAAFLGAFAAVNYVENCQRGWPDKTQPVEDADFLAKQAWDQMEEHNVR